MQKVVIDIFTEWKVSCICIPYWLGRVQRRIQENGPLSHDAHATCDKSKGGRPYWPDFAELSSCKSNVNW